MTEQVYHRARAVAYAQKWAFSRNPAFLNFDGMGGDCTNFASQCLYAGSGIMNYTDTFGWYYRSSRDRSPSWTGVPYLYNFLISNKSVGPYAVQTDAQQVLPGDLVQLGTRRRAILSQPGDRRRRRRRHICGRPHRRCVYATAQQLHIRPGAIFTHCRCASLVSGVTAGCPDNFAE